MPQFDFAHVFWPQLIWLLACFAVLYFGVVQLTLPRLGRVVDARESRIAADLAAARAAKADADDHHSRYQVELNRAREKARGDIAEAKLAAARAREGRLAQAHEETEALIHAAEGRIGKAVTVAEAGLAALIADNAGAIVTRVTGKAPAAATVKAAVEGHRG